MRFSLILALGIIGLLVASWCFAGIDQPSLVTDPTLIALITSTGDDVFATTNLTYGFLAGFAMQTLVYVFARFVGAPARASRSRGHPPRPGRLRAPAASRGGVAPAPNG